MRMPGKTHGLERMIFFSDAVIAIMLTLLALELPVPHADDPEHLWAALAEHGSHYLAFIISFAVIAASWVAHHMFFTYVSRSDPALVTLNLLVLLAYVLIPWASKTLGDDTNSAGVIVYSAVMAFAGASMSLLVGHVRRAGLLDPLAPPAVITTIRAWYAATAIMFTLSVPAAFLMGRWTMIIWTVGYLAVRVATGYHNRKNHTSTPQPEPGDATLTDTTGQTDDQRDGVVADPSPAEHP
jgi:uncharacterized membrane protein